MKVIAVHDPAGTILSLVVSPEEGPTFGVEPRVGQYVHTVEISELSLDMPEPEIFQRLDEVARTYRVDVAEQFSAAPPARLVAKGGQTGP
ncbi:hypothetical protein OG562_23350 [Streptomyces sp. NBC_01275]|uniref:hypothetical protein n=1 Tax=Streptomyces sp. NBC_01275 TaxID=2903807 RepID=UPI00225A6B49|nr:hypothetical protein [Streptomyces sp. NBC_01275]MCX4763849.1 hypothetical protein [Streptomyces sp. NBC_01275]